MFLTNLVFLIVMGINVTKVSASPLNTSLPTISGSNIVDSTLKATKGSWSGSIENYIYQWRRCTDSLNASTCVAIQGANTSSYKITSNDVGKFLRFNVIAVDASGSTTSVLSVSTLAIVAPPKNSVLPKISGEPNLGNILSTNSGTWTLPNQGIFRFRWLRCSSITESSCSPIANANTSTYVVNDLDIGRSIRSEVTVFDVTGKVSSTVKSSGTAFVASLPKNTLIPSISGSPTTGETLIGNSGNWLAYPEATITIQWQRCTSTDTRTCKDIAEEKKNSYLTLATDINQYFRLLVTSLNNLGGTIKYSEIFGPILQQTMPRNVQAPSITGFPVEGSTLTVDDGIWTGLPNPTYAYKWYLCEQTSVCVEAKSLNEKTLKLDFTYGGRYLKAKVLATNILGTAEAETQPILVDAFFRVLAKPSINGKLAVGAILNATNGTWTKDENNLYEYSWQSCQTSDILSCKDIAATTSNYKIRISDFGKRLRVGVSVSQKSSFAYSELTKVIKKTLDPQKQNVACKKIGKYGISSSGKLLKCREFNGKKVWR